MLPHDISSYQFLNITVIVLDATNVSLTPACAFYWEARSSCRFLDWIFERKNRAQNSCSAGTCVVLICTTHGLRRWRIFNANPELDLSLRSLGSFNFVIPCEATDEDF
jgi:hypothetical protein